MPFAGDTQAAVDGVRIEGQLLDGAGEPVPDGLIEVWQEEQFARCCTGPRGGFHFIVRKPPARAGPDGRTQAPHLEVLVFARGLLRQLATRIYFPDEVAANAADPALERAGERRDTLVARYEGGVLRFDIRLQGTGETVFFEL